MKFHEISSVFYDISFIFFIVHFVFLPADKGCARDDKDESFVLTAKIFSDFLMA